MENDKTKRASYMREWRLKNLERAREISRLGSAKYSAANPEKRAKSSRESASRLRKPRSGLDVETLECVRAQARQRYREKAEKDPSYVPKKMDRNKQWRAENPDLARKAVREAMRRWRDRNPDKVLERAERYKAKKIAQQAQARRAIRMALLDFFGGKCVRCGFSDGRALHLDHVNGNGNKERKVGKGNKWDQFALVKSDPEAARAKYQLLCANCNTIKQFENGEYRTVG